MKNDKKGFTLIELLAVIVILALIMGIAITAMGDVIAKSERNASRRTAESLIDGVKQRLQLAGHLQAGTYVFDKTILDKGGITSPLGGDWRYATIDDSEKITGVSGIGSRTMSECSNSVDSFVTITKDANDNFSYKICLTTTGAGSGKYINATLEELEKNSDSVIH